MSPFPSERGPQPAVPAAELPLAVPDVGAVAIGGAPAEATHIPDADSAPKPATTEAVTKITFEAFRHSQGIPGNIQRLFIQYAADYEQVRHPLDAQAVRNSFPLLRQQVRRFLDSSTAHRATRVQKVFERDVRASEAAWETVLAKEPFKGEFDARWRGVVSVLLMHTVSRDFSFLVGEEGRPRSRADSTESNPFGKYLSHLVYYGMLGQSTGVAGYDHLYGRIGERLRALPNYVIPVYLTSARNRSSKRYTGVHNAVSRLAAVHLDHYPADNEKLPPEWKQYLTEANKKPLRTTEV